MRYHLIPVRTGVINKSTNDKFWQGCGERGTLCIVVGMQIGTATAESNVKIPQKLKMKLPYYPVVTLLGIYPKKPKMNY